MKCTGRRLIAYTLCVVFVSYGSAYLIHAQAPVMPFGLGEVVLPAVGTISPTSQSAETTSETTGRERLVVPGAVTKVSPPPPPKPEQPKPEQTSKSEESPPPPPYEPPASPPPAINDNVPVKHAAGKYVKPKSDKPEDNQLTAELVDHYAEDNVVMVTWANNHYYDFVSNWVRNVRKCGISNFMVGAMDNELLAQLVDVEVPTFAMQSGMITTDFGWGTPNFHKMGRKKIELIYLFTQMGFDILVSDVDTAWLRNPMPYMARFPQADVLTSSDHLSSTAVGDGLEDPSRAHSAANIGIMLLRHSAKELAKEWVEKLEKDDKIWDQNAFNDLFRLGAGFNQKDEDNVFAGYRGKLKIGILPVSTFASGHTYFVTRMYEKVKQDPYVIHATFQFSGTDGKRHRLREALVWSDPPEYYDPPGGLLSYVADIPEDLLRHSGSIEGHFALVNHQLLQVRAALAFAQKLNRTLVMPKLYCGFDRWWAPHSGKIPGSDTELPYLCPMDHVFEIESWVREENDAEFGPGIDFREYSFFNNPALSEAVNSSRLDVELVESCEDGKCTQNVGAAAPKDTKKIVANTKLTDVNVEKLLSAHKDVKVIQFSTMVGAFGGFVDKQDMQKFSRRLKKYAAIWCCKNAHPGHIWYDMEFDVIPHTDRHNRVWDKPWTPTTGP